MRPIPRHIQIRERRARRRLVDPLRQIVDKHIARLRRRDRRAEDLPIALSPIPITRVEGHAVGVLDGRVEGGLPVVDGLGHERGVDEAVVVEVVQEAVGRGVVVGQDGVLGVVCGVDAEGLPLCDVVVRDGGVVCGVCVLADAGCDLGGCFEADDAFEGQVGLVGKVPCEVVRGELLGGEEGVFDEVFGPLFDDWVVLLEVVIVACALSVGEKHDDVVAAFFDGHVLVVAVGVACCVGVVRA